MDLLSLFPDRYLLQPYKFVFSTPLPAEGNTRSITSRLQIAEELLCGMITWASCFRGVGDRSKQGGCIPLSHRCVGWRLPRVMGAQESLVWSHCSLLLTYLLGNSFPCSAAWLLWRKMGCGSLAQLWAVVGCDRSPRMHVDECSPQLVLHYGWSVVPMEQLHYGWLWYVVWAETATIQQKLMKKGKNESSHPYSLPHLFFQCKYFMSTDRWMLGMPLLFTLSSTYLSVNHQAVRLRAIRAEQMLCPMDVHGCARPRVRAGLCRVRGKGCEPSGKPRLTYSTHL